MHCAFVLAIFALFSVPLSASADDESSTYYVVSPELTNGQHLERFKMHMTRNRIWKSSKIQGDGKDNSDYLELNVKYDELLGNGITKDTEIHWWIENGDTTKVYYADYSSDDSDFKLGYTNTKTKKSDYNLGLNATWDYYGCKAVNTASPTKNRFYFTIGDDKSFTFLLDKEGSDKNVGFVHNRSIQESTGATPSDQNGFNDGSGYYLIANLKTAKTGNVEMEPYKSSDWKTIMTKYYYKDLVAYTSDQWTSANLSNPDSVVYRVHVDKPKGGWNYLYINIMPSGLEKAWSASTWSDKAAGWNYVIRPQLWSFSFSNTTERDTKGVDAHSIAGGLTQYNDPNHDLCHNQSLNPNMDDVAKALGLSSADDIGSYDFSMNITTSTYRIVFNKPKALDLRDYSDVYYKSGTSNRKVKGIGEYKYFTRYSDHVTYIKPSDIDAFVVTDFEIKDGRSVVTLHKLTNTFDTDGKTAVLPNDVGLILAVKNVTDGQGTVNSFAPTANTTNFRTVTYSLTEAQSQHVNFNESKSLLTPQVESITVPQEIKDKDGNVVAYNYIFSFYKHSKWSNDGKDKEDGKDVFDLGFWLLKGTTPTYSNDAYLRLNKEQVGNYRVGTSYDLSSSSSAKAIPAVFVQFDDMNTATGISEVEQKRYDDDAYYTLQGVRVSRPATAGIYIHNGKKVIWK